MIQQFFTELRRRNVLRVAGAYAVASWGILQAADAIFPRLGLPDWTFTFVAALLVIGLPLSTIIAWAFELTPNGIRRTRDLESPAEFDDAGAGGMSWVDPALVAVLVVAVGISAFQVATRAPAGAAPVITRATLMPSVAVLPFATFSDDSEDGYFADGLTEELINSLAQIEGLQVPGRTSSFHFKNKNEDLREVGRKLNVAHVLEGSVRRAQDRLRVTVQLISAEDGFHLWSRTYDRDLTDVFAIQQNIAAQVAAQLKRTLLSDDGGQVDATLERDSYPQFLIATALLHEGTRDSVTRARGMFEQIVANEPGNVEALAGYARATMLLAGAFLALDFEPAAAAAIDAVEHALALEPDSIAANLAAGRVYDLMAFRTDEPQYLALAERALTRAMAIAPGDPEVLGVYGGLLSRTGRFERALDVVRQGFERDPMNRAAQLRLAEAYRGVGRLGEAKTELESLLEREPGYTAAQLELGELLIETGAFAAALPHLRIAHESRMMPRATFALANVLLNMGRSEQVRRTIAALDYAPLSKPLGDMVLLMAAEDATGALALAERELRRTDDRIWRPLVVLLALNAGDLDEAREQLRALEPALLVPQADISRTVPTSVLFAANLLQRDGHIEQARDLLEALLERLAPPAAGFDPSANKILRAHAYAQLGRADDALAELGAARAQGYRTLFDFDYFMRIDRYPTFATIRNEPRLEALIEAIQLENRAIAVDEAVAASTQRSPIRN